MEPIIIAVSWEYFLGIFGALIIFAWYANGRFTKLETSMEWVKDTLKDIKIDAENKSVGAFARHSPISLTDEGKVALEESGLKEWIDVQKDELIALCADKKYRNPYEVQEYIFDYFDTLEFDSEFADKLKRTAFEMGYSMEIMRRIGAIYFRDLCLAQFDMKIEDIDKHDPNHTHDA